MGLSGILSTGGNAMLTKDIETILQNSELFDLFCELKALYDGRNYNLSAHNEYKQAITNFKQLFNLYKTGRK